MNPWFVTKIHPPDEPQPPVPYCHFHGHHHHGCHHHPPPPSNESSFPSMMKDALDRVKGIPGTHEFTFTRTLEPEKKDPWAEYYEKLNEYYKMYPHMAPPHYHHPPPPPQHHCCHHGHH